jgi:hypothetical protein
MKMQNWIKRGLIIRPQKKKWNLSHCMLPTPLKINENKFKIFFGSRNNKNQSSIGSVDILFKKQGFKVTNYTTKPLLKPGKLGHFDDNGVLPSSIIKKRGKTLLYYIGWQPRSTTRYSLIAGLSISADGINFKRFFNSPILKTNNSEPISILTAPHVIRHKNKYFMWYVSGIKWKTKDYPLYNIKLAISKDGFNWIQTKKVCINLKKNERAVARPFVIFKNKKFRMWYSYEKKVGHYKIGYAESVNGKDWKRLDDKININTKENYEIKMRAYPSIIPLKQKLFMLYNGDNYGEKGILLAELKDSFK